MAVRRLAEGGAEAAGEVASRHEGAARQRGDVKRPRVVAVHGVPRPPQPDEVLRCHRPSIACHLSRQVALAWLLLRSATTVLIPGTSSVPHLHENVAASDLRLPADEVAQLDAIAG
ncbi:hypothetical protein GT002_05790 [Streptomyces sp. SID4917]|nr:hypothetical protein [Streptomyces sp. SID4917]